MKKYKLSDLFDLRMGKTPARNNPKYWEEGTNPWISIADMSSNGKYITTTKECITNRAISETGIKPIFPGTVIMSFKLSIGKVARTTVKSYSNEAIMAFEIKDREPSQYTIDNDYAYYLLSALNFENIGNKAVMGKTLNKAILENTEVYVHPWDEQRRIISKLDKVIELIELRTRQLSKLDELVKSRFIELFGDPDTNPLGWNEDALSEHLEVIGGYAFKSDKFEDEGIPVLRIGNINSGRFLPVNMVYWNDDPALERYKMHPGDLVMSLTGTVGKDDYGNVCVLGSDYPEYYLNQRNAKLSLEPTLNAKYLSELLKFDRIKRRLTGISRGVRQANISNKDILCLCVPIAPINLQQQFAAFVEQTDKSKIEIQKSLKQLETLKKALMQKYFG